MPSAAKRKGTASAGALATKRKRSTTKTDGKPRKRSRSESGSDADDASDDDAGTMTAQDRILALESQVFESKKHYNNIVALVELANSAAAGDSGDSGDEQALTAAVSLSRIFLRLLAAGQLGWRDGMTEKDLVVVRWLRERLAEAEQVLVGLFGRSGDAASTALTLAMRLLQAEGQHLRRGAGEEGVKTNRTNRTKKDAKKNKGNSGGAGDYHFPQAFLGQIVRALLATWQTLGADVAETLLAEFVDTYGRAYHDVRFYTFKAVAAALAEDGAAADGGAEDKSADAGGSGGNDGVGLAAFFLLSRLDEVPTAGDLEPDEDDEDDDAFSALGDDDDDDDDDGAASAYYVTPPPAKRSHALYAVAQHKKLAQAAWVALLLHRASRRKEQRKRVLAIVSTVVAPWFTQPELLLDFLTDCYDAGGATSLLALSGLYYLIRERNVDYPAFYAKLYSLLDAGLLHSKHRARFFRLMDSFLASTHLPAQLVASFIKRLARLCLFAPPAAIVSVVPWFYNLFRAHPLCTFLLHRVPRSADEREALARDGLADPFRAAEPDPMATQAIDSCLWEIVQLQSHYHPNVATIAKIISEQFTKQSYNLEDFLDHSYQSMFDAEIGKEVKRTPVVEFHIPKRIFFPEEAEAEGEKAPEEKLLTKLWDFS